jgi:DNA-binding transcriptional ArsR family regulator
VKPIKRAALADPNGRQILEELRQGELSAGEIVIPLSYQRRFHSRHLAILKART